jgi:methyltransferase (TIGR00027 family)
MVVDNPPHLICDTDARAVCELFEPSPLAFQLGYPNEPVLAAARASAVIRSWFAQRILAEARLDQLVVLGAGLDTSLTATGSGQAWVVDTAEVLAWRAELFGLAAVHDPAHPVPVDLGSEDLLAALAEAGLDVNRPTAVVALGLSMYLTEAQFQALLARLAAFAPGSVLIFDALVPDVEADEAGRAYAAAVTAHAGGREPWRWRPTENALSQMLEVTGWKADLRAEAEAEAEADAVPPEFWQANPQLVPMRLVQLIHARTRLGATLNADESVG